MQETIPKNVICYCPRCGSGDFITRDEGHSFLCEACSFNYYVNNSAAVACIITDNDGKIILSKRAINPNKGMLDLPGGFVDPGESAEDAVIREIKEELGVNVTEMKYLISFPNKYIFSGYSVATLDLAFLCKIDDISKIVPQDDISSVIFVHPDEIKLDELCSESMKNIIRHYIVNKPEIY